ncbi:MAG: BMP family ABC transporter substrate-binding protein [Anaerovibrio sp.]|uniref:BMP family ABC transporter substrate-binding protein n=1 Tax=Anaerovibrio sp. TaxID=1872532 RepID=UPI0025D5A613|nr:BMP family ABC transporter substrate-binding protein [Anaerovibrio sp.]MCR5175523.1 BMP family ABC transporter substrate-binding protein [Anaerovibrio sp.]
MEVNRHERLKRRFTIFALLQAFLICLTIFLSINYFGSTVWEQRTAIGLILVDARNDSGWPREITQGLQSACDGHHYNLYIEDKVPVDEANLERITKKMLGKNVKKIFLIGDFSSQAIESIAKKHPNVTFFTNSIEDSYADNIFKFSVRYHEARYLAGILAGLHTKSDIIGYIAPFPSLETYQDLNAFALGVQKVRPDIKVKVIWTEIWHSVNQENKALYLLQNAGADIITYYGPSQHIAQEAAALEVDYIDFHNIEDNSSPHCIAAIDPDWQTICDHLLDININKSLSKYYWRGMMDDVITLHLGPDISPKEKSAVLDSQEKILAGYPIFSGEIIDQHGITRCKTDTVIDNNSLRKGMNWLVKGVDIIETR